MSPGDPIVEEQPTRLARQGWFGMAIDLLLVLAAAGVVLFASTWPSVTGHLPLVQVDLLLALASAGLAAGAALIAWLTSRMSAPSLVGGYSAALACYAIVVMPLSVMHASPVQAGLQAARMTANVCFLGMLLLALFPTTMRWLSSWLALLCAVAVTVLAGLLAGWLPGYHAFFLDGATLPERLVLLGWCVVAALFMARGALTKQSTTWRMGLAVAILAIAHLILIGQRPGTLPFAALRALGLMMLVLVLGLHAWEVARGIVRRREAEAQRLRTVEIATAERDHEMRNVLSGLSGAAYVLSSGGQALPELGGAVHRELERLRALLERSPSPSDPDSVPLEDVLRQLVTLRRAVGEPMELDVEPGLRTAVPAAVLAQVVTNLLVNCARHAPGASVRVTARSENDNTVVTVVDDGPGISGRAPAREGGFGVPVSARLLAEHGGSLRFESGEGGLGCVAVVSLPAGGAERAAQAAPQERPVVGIA
ncbi:MAG: sensor histidine kinase [Sciscionella sp.]